MYYVLVTAACFLGESHSVTVAECAAQRTVAGRGRTQWRVGQAGELAVLAPARCLSPPHAGNGELGWEVGHEKVEGPGRLRHGPSHQLAATGDQLTQ
jgi:hypothetical protein